MIAGLGTDLIEIERVRVALERHGDRFAQRVLGPAEYRIWLERHERCAARGVAYLATRFAAKEALSKALGLGLVSPMSWRAAEILNTPGGAPQVVTHGELANYVAARGLRLSVSITDEQTMAMATVIAETSDTLEQ
ncbi:MAG: holo-ACP synthase [Burkholderiaceae bacterium]